jgi:hypothetical protein
MPDTARELERFFVARAIHDGGKKAAGRTSLPVFSERLGKLLGDPGGIIGDPQYFATAARQHGGTIVDAERNRSWIDEAAYARALQESHYGRERAAAAERLCQACGFALNLPAEVPKP